MLILPPGHAQRARERRPFTPREKWGGIAGGLVVLAVAIVVVISLVGGGASKAGPGCINVSIASTLGNQPITGCGVHAKEICAQLGRPGSGGYRGESRTQILDACRNAGLSTS